MIKILIGSKNPVRINAVKGAFSKYFKNEGISETEILERDYVDYQR